MTKQIQPEVVQPRYPGFEQDVERVLEKFGFVLGERYDLARHKADLMLDETLTGISAEKIRTEKESLRKEIKRVVLYGKGRIPNLTEAQMAEVNDMYVVKPSERGGEGVGILYTRRIMQKNDGGEDYGDYVRNFDGDQSLLFWIPLGGDQMFEDAFALSKDGSIFYEGNHELMEALNGKDYSENGSAFLRNLERILNEKLEK